jgi:ketosteroid isomerase-like protein
MKRLIINTVAILLLTAVSFGTRAQSEGELKASVAKMNQEMIELAKTGRYEAMDKYYNNDVISMPNNRAAENGFNQVLTSNLQRKNGGYKILEGQKTTSELFVSGDIMVDVGTYSMTVSYPGPAEPVKDFGKYINVWQKDRNGDWKIVAETWNTDKSSMAGQSKGQTKQEAGYAPSVNPNSKTGTQTGTQASGAAGSGNKTSQTGIGMGSESKTVPVQGTTTKTGTDSKAVPVQGTTTKTGTDSKAVPVQGATTKTGTDSKTVPVQGTTTKTGTESKTVPVQGTTTKTGTDSKTVPAQGTSTKTGTVPVQGTTETKDGKK